MVPGCLSGLISRAMPRDGLHGDSKERPLITGSIMQGTLLTNVLYFSLVNESELIVTSNSEANLNCKIDL